MSYFTSYQILKEAEFVNYLFFTLIALVTGIFILVRVLFSKSKLEKKGFVELIIISIVHNVIDMFWGLTYYDILNIGTTGLFISTSLYFCSNALVSFAWFSLLYRLLFRDKAKKIILHLSAIPVAIVFALVFINIWTGSFFNIGDSIDSYQRGPWYQFERLIITAYFVIPIIWAIIKLILSKDKSERKKNTIIIILSLIPLIFDVLQVFIIYIPCTSIAFQLAIVISYIFISIDKSENVLLSSFERQKSNFKVALVKVAMSWYEFNLDQDYVYDSEIYLDKYNSSEQPNIIEKKYSKYYEFLLNRVFPEFVSLYKETYSIENLKKNFEKGKSEVYLRYWIRDRLGEKKYVSQTIILTRDKVSNEIVGFSYVKDITNEELQKREIEEQLEEITLLNRQLKYNQKINEEINEELRNKISQIQSMSKIYFSSFFIDILNNTFVEIRTIDAVRKFIGTSGNAKEALKIMCDEMVSKETSENLRKFADLSTIDERMKENEVITCDYVGLTSGWCQLYMIAGDRDENGKILTLFVAARKIHDEKLREELHNKEIKEAKIEAERANSAKTSFLFNMSHDIRTPMNAIIGFRNLLEKNQEDPVKRADYLKKIEEASTVLLSIINNVLEMARIEKGTIELVESVWSVEQFNDSLFSVCNEMMVQKGITFTRKINVKNNYVYCDSTKLREVFLNILSNAHKYTKSGGKVDMVVEEIDSDKEGYGLYKTTITDTGIGMSEDFLPHIFEEFSRESTTTYNKIEGTGLGMPIVKHLIEVMNGTIQISSKKGQGTIVEVILPHRIAQKENRIAYSEIEANENDFKGKRILLAEDNNLNAEIATEILKDLGFEITHAVDGQECVNILTNSKEGYFDLILMDIQMPNMNGYQATKAIRALNDDKKANIPILAMTANAFEEDKKEAYNCGMNGHIPKPINIKYLIKELANILGKK